MVGGREPSQQWQLSEGLAWVYIANAQAGMVAPFILAADANDGSTDLAAFAAGVDHKSYSLLSALTEAGRDLILLGYDNGNADLATHADIALAGIRRATAERRGTLPLVVGGLGRGALVTRYALATMEIQRMDHQTGVYVSYNGAAPSSEEAATLKVVDDWPARPYKLKAASGEVTDELNNDDFDDSLTGSANSGTSLITEELGYWIVERLP